MTIDLGAIRKVTRARRPLDGYVSHMKGRVLIVDDDLEMRVALDLLFSSAGHTCELAADGVAALGIVSRQPVDVVVSDVRMEGMDGLELMDRLKESHPGLPFIVITAAGAIAQAVDAVKRGAFQYMVKPCDAEDLRKVVTQALARG